MPLEVGGALRFRLEASHCGFGTGHLPSESLGHYVSLSLGMGQREDCRLGKA
jgi:hypothetical protein